MTTQTLAHDLKKEKSAMAYNALAIAVIIVLGAVVSAVVYGIRYAISGFVPHFLSLSGIGLDVVSGVFYSLILACYLIGVTDKHEAYNKDCAEHGEDEVSFWEFLGGFEGQRYLVYLLIATFIVSAIWTFAIGLACVVAIGIIDVIRWLVEVIPLLRGWDLNFHG